MHRKFSSWLKEQGITPEAILPNASEEELKMLKLVLLRYPDFKESDFLYSPNTRNWILVDPY